tara:strand:+ start:87 stop:725 length:639 start_codon:yes stop_codon:yes gene_type:complete
MNERNLILKVLKLDRDIHNNLLQSSNAFQLLIPLFFIYQFVSYFVGKVLSLNYLKYLKTFIATNSEYLGASPDEINSLSNEIDYLIQIINTPLQIADIFPSVFIGLILLSIYLGSIFLGLKIKQIKTNFKDLIVLYLASLIPKIFYLIVLFVDKPVFQGLIVFVFFIYSLVVRFSAFKQIYFLNNFEAFTTLIIWPFVIFFTTSYLLNLLIL